MYGDKIDSPLLTAWTPFEMVSSLLKMKWKQHVNNHDLNDCDVWKYRHLKIWNNCHRLGEVECKI